LLCVGIEDRRSVRHPRLLSQRAVSGTHFEREPQWRIAGLSHCDVEIVARTALDRMDLACAERDPARLLAFCILVEAVYRDNGKADVEQRAAASVAVPCLQELVGIGGRHVQIKERMVVVIAVIEKAY